MNDLSSIIGPIMIALCVIAVIVCATILSLGGINYSTVWTENCLKSGQSIVAGNCLPIRKDLSQP